MFYLVLVLLLLAVPACDGDDPPARGGGSSDRLAPTVEATSRPTVDDMERATREVLDVFDDRVPGILVVVRAGEDIRTLATGVANMADGAPIRPTQPFQIASITKSLVATLVMQLVESGEVDLDNPVAQWLPGLVPNGGRITVEHLLSHQSGLVEYTELPGLAEIVKYDPRELVRLAVEEPPLFPPGTAAEYSNTNYIVLGLIVEEATGEPLTAVIKDRIFRPLGMQDSVLGMAGVPARSMVHGYDDEGRDVTIKDLAPIASGGVVSTALDVNRFFHALFSGELVAAATLRQMTSPISYVHGDTGLGLGEWGTACGPAWGHDGGLPGFTSIALTLPQDDRGVVVFINETLAVTEANGIAITALCP